MNEPLDFKVDLQRKSELLNSLVGGLILLQVMALSIMLMPPISQWFNFLIVGFSLTLNMAVFYLNRRKFTQLAAHLICHNFNIFAAIFIPINLMVEKNPDDASLMSYGLALSVLLAGILISARAIFWFAALNTALVFVPYAIVSATLVIALRSTFPIIGFFYMVAVISWLYRKSTDQAFVRLSVAHQDIKEKEKALTESLFQIEQAKQEWESTVDTLPHLVCLLDNHGHIIRTNRTVERWGLGKVTNVKGWELHELLHPDCTDSACYLETFRAETWKQLAQGHAVECEANDVALKRYFHIQVQPISTDIRRSAGALANFAVAVIYDITERKQVEAERERLLIAEREQRLLAETLGDVFLALTAQTNRQAILNEILCQTQHLVSYSAANIVLLEDNILHIACWQGYEAFGSDKLMSNLKQPLDHFPLDAEVIQLWQPLVVYDTQQNPRWTTTAESAWVRSFMAIPICLEDRILGLLRLDSHTPSAFFDKDAERLLPLTNAAAIAVENARLYAQVQQELVERKQAEAATREFNQQLLTLQYAGATIASSLDLQVVLDSVTREMVELLEVECCTIFEWDQVANTTSVMARYNLCNEGDEGQLHQVYPLADSSLVKQVLTERQFQQIISSQADRDPVVLAIQRRQIKTLLMLPMEFHDQVVGLVEAVDSRFEHTLSFEKSASIQLLANQAASSIENARLYQKIQQELDERRRVEKELRQSETRHRALLNAVPDSIFHLTVEGVFLDYSAGNVEDLYSSPENFIGKKVGDVLPPEVAKLIQHYIHKTITTKVNQVFEYKLPMLAGSQYYEACVVIGGADEVFIIVRNITERKRVEQKTIHTERLTALGRLAATLAHEMNNPLQAIRSHLDLVLDFPLEPGEDENYLHIIRHEATRLTDIVQRVLNFARSQPTPHQPVSVVKQVQQVLKLASKQLEQCDIQVTTDFLNVPSVLASPAQLNQIFLNLTLNVIEAVTDQGQLHIAVYPEGNQVAISFTNNGYAIPPDVLPHIFDPFFTTKQQGSGLGLWVSYNLVQQHRGRLTVENINDERGVIFTIKLPSASSSVLETALDPVS